MSLLTDGLFFVDDRGKTVIAKPKDTAFGRAEEQEILREAVEVAGWVAVFADPARSAVNVQISAAHVTEKAITATGMMLLSYQFKEVRISCLGTEWRREAHSDPAEAASALFLMLQDADRDLAAARFKEQHLDAHRLLGNDVHEAELGLMAVMQAWSDHQGKSFNRMLQMLESLELMDTAMIVELSEDHSPSIIRHFGQDFIKRCPQLGKLLNQPLDKHPEPHFARWLDGRYRMIAEAMEPELFDMRLAEPIFGLDSYRCLRLPWALKDGGYLVTSLRIDGGFFPGRSGRAAA